MTSWPEPVERVTAFLARAGAEVRVEEFPAGTSTAQEAADAVGCKLGEIVKSLVFEGDGRTALAMVPGDRRADAAKVAEAVGARRARVASPDRVRELTGYGAGAVAPFPPPEVDGVLLDRHLLLPEYVWVGAGSENHIARVTPVELQRLSRATPVDLVADP